jgi:hypothetical protein
VRWSRADGEAHAEFARAAGGQVRDNAVESEAGEQEREDSEGTDQHQIQALCEQGAGDDFGHRVDVVERLVGVDLADGGADGGGYGGWVAGGFDHHSHTILGALSVGPIDLRARVAVQAFVANMSRDADDFSPRHSGDDRNAEALAERALVAEDLAGDAVIEDTDLCVVGRVVLTEVAAGDDGDAEGAEVVGAGGAGIDIHCPIVAFELDLERLHLAAEREAVDDGGGLHAGRGLHAIHEARKVAPDIRVRGAVRRTIHGEVKAEDAIGLEAGVGAAHVDEAAHQQACGDQEHDSAGDFSADEEVAHAGVGGGAALEARGDLQGGRDGDGKCGGDRKRNSEQQDRQMDGDLFDARQSWREERDEEFEE